MTELLVTLSSDKGAARKEDVRVIAVGHNFSRVGAGQAEGVREFVRLLGERRHLLQASLVAQLFKV